MSETKKFTVIAVDDSAIIRTMMRKYLRDEAEFLGEGKNGAEGVELYKKALDGGNPPDLVLMDITMDHMDGMEAARAILDMNKDAKIIMVSALSDTDNIKNCIDMGVSDYIVKPFSGESLMDSIRNTLS